MNDKHSKIQAQLDAIRLSYIESLKTKRETIEVNWASLNNDWVADTYDSLYLVIHGLAGSAETFGFPEITQQARVVVNEFKELNPHHAPKSGDLVHQIDRDIGILMQTLRQTTQT